MSKENKNKNQTYSGNSIASYWLSGTLFGITPLLFIQNQEENELNNKQ